MNLNEFQKILNLIKKIIPKSLFRKIQPGYHLAMNWLAGVWYGFPSEKLIVVGITGTTGKTTTVFMLAELLKNAGLKVGYTSTAMFSDGEKEWLNDKKMTMLGRFFTQRMLRRMVRNKCQVAIVETTSEGIVQNRHRFINYDMVEFTGLYPEHIDSHGSFENYKKAKLKLFEHLEKCSKKDLGFKIYDLRDIKEGGNEQGPAFPPERAVSIRAGRAERSERKAGLSRSTRSSGRIASGNIIPKTIIVNLDDKYAGEFLDAGDGVERKMGFIRRKIQEARYKIQTNNKLQDTNIETQKHNELEEVKYEFLEMNKVGTKFRFEDEEVQLKILGEFNALNATAAGCVGKALGLNNENIKKGLEGVKSLPGRLERINEGQNFTVMVDYAFEPVAVGKLYETVAILEPNKIIHVLGSTGGGRDVDRRAKLGKLAGERADYVIVTNEDPYDDDPMEIIKMVAEGAEKVGKVKDENLFLIKERREGIKKAISLAGENDLVLITGKGSEQAIAGPNGKLIPWDDRKVAREVIKSLGS